MKGEKKAPRADRLVYGVSFKARLEASFRFKAVLYAPALTARVYALTNDR